ncbi:MAG: hypothetical protein IPK35_14920 [Saprospiraceae bacterium]|jgi:hypothetical protein|nr:hypothetical protein [Saprospiraceae bacterium]
MKDSIFIFFILLFVLFSCRKQSEEVVADVCFTGSGNSILKCIPTDSIYLEGKINGKSWKAKKFRSDVGTGYKNYFFVGFDAVLPYDSCKSYAYLSLGSDVWGNLGFKNVYDTIFFRNSGHYSIPHPGFGIVDTNGLISHRLIFEDTLSKSNYITLSGVNQDSSILEGSFALEYMHINGSFKSEFKYISGKFRLNKCR